MKKCEFRQVKYLEHVIESAAVEVSGKWYPLLRILNYRYLVTHPWQVPAVDGVTTPETAAELGVFIAQEMIDDENPMKFR